MSSGTTPSLKLELTVYGYLREKGKQYKLMIPSDLNSIIIMFYQKVYTLFGIGNDTYNQFQLKQQIEAKSDSTYDPDEPKEKCYHLIEFSKLCQHPDFISVPNENFFIQNNNELYAIGNNRFGTSMIPIKKHQQTL